MKTLLIRILDAVLRRSAKPAQPVKHTGFVPSDEMSRHFDHFRN